MYSGAQRVCCCSVKMRSIHKVIIHCSASPEGVHYDVEDIRNWHLARGFSDVGYHFVITIDGLVQPGRPLDQQGAHTRSHNGDSIGICYIGGVEATRERKPKDTMTADQERALGKLIQGLRIVLGKELTLYGHNEFSKKACPSFIVSQRLPWLL